MTTVRHQMQSPTHLEAGRLDLAVVKQVDGRERLRLPRAERQRSSASDEARQHLRTPPCATVHPARVSRLARSPSSRLQPPPGLASTSQISAEVLLQVLLLQEVLLRTRAALLSADPGERFAAKGALQHQEPINAHRAARLGAHDDGRPARNAWRRARRIA